VTETIDFIDAMTELLREIESYLAFMDVVRDV
jgi:hypothetical protein